MLDIPPCVKVCAEQERSRRINMSDTGLALTLLTARQQHASPPPRESQSAGTTSPVSIIIAGFISPSSLLS